MAARTILKPIDQYIGLCNDSAAAILQRSGS